MEDSQIVELYWQRSSDAIAESSAKYGGYGMSVSAVKSSLFRTRQKLRLCLEEEGLL